MTAVARQCLTCGLAIPDAETAIFITRRRPTLLDPDHRALVGPFCETCVDRDAETA